MDKEIIPDSLIKYYALTHYNIDALLNQYFYFSHPLEVNDPFEAFQQRLDLSAISEGKMKKFFYDNFHFVFPNEQRTYERVNQLVEEKYINEDELLKWLRNIYWNVIYNKLGILSLTNKEDSLLMWSYYTNHIGFSVKYKKLVFNQNEINGPFQILYDNKFLDIAIKELEIDDNILCNHLNVKSLDWSHENEWRYILKGNNLRIPDYNLIGNDCNNKVNYSIDRIENVVLGFKFFKENITREYISEDEYFYRFDEIKEYDKLRVLLLNFIVDNRIVVKQVYTNEDNTFTLVSLRISIQIIERNRVYIVKTIK